MQQPKQTSGGLPAILMGVLFLGVGLGALAWLVASLGWPVQGARAGSFYVLFVMFCSVLVPACLVVGVLAILGGYRKLRAGRPGAPR